MRATTTDLGPTIIETLYCEALMLADEARGAFDLFAHSEPAGNEHDLARIALSCEALRTTTRMMHAIAWLLNQRAFFAGDLSEFQLRRHGRLPPAGAESDAGQRRLLPPELRELTDRTRRFYARVERLDHAWQGRFAMRPEAIHRLRERLGLAVQAF